MEESEEEKGALPSEDEGRGLTMTQAKRNMFDLVDEIKDGPWFTHP